MSQEEKPTQWEEEFDEKFSSNTLGFKAFWTPPGGKDDDAEEIKSFIRSLLLSEHKRWEEKINKNIGFLRQWINELPDDFRLITNKDIETWLNLEK